MHLLTSKTSLTMGQPRKPIGLGLGHELTCQQRFANVTILIRCVSTTLVAVGHALIARLNGQLAFMGRALTTVGPF